MASAAVARPRDASSLRARSLTAVRAQRRFDRSASATITAWRLIVTLAAPYVCLSARAAGDALPENTLHAVEAAAAWASGFEFDAQLAGDGSLVALHDADLARTTNASGLVRLLPYDDIRRLDAAHGFCAVEPPAATAEVPQHEVAYQRHKQTRRALWLRVCRQRESLPASHLAVPLIRDVMQEVVERRRLPLLVEVKLGVDARGATEALRRLLNDTDAAPSLVQLRHRYVAVMSFSPELLYRVRRELPDVATVLLVGHDLMSRYCHHTAASAAASRPLAERLLCASPSVLDRVVWWVGYPIVAWWIGVSGVAPHYSSVCEQRHADEAAVVSCDAVGWWRRVFGWWVYVWGVEVERMRPAASVGHLLAHLQQLGVSWTPSVLPLPPWDEATTTVG